MRTLSRLSLLLVALLLGGCSAIRTVYNQADHVAAWRADDYFDLTDEQKRAFRSTFSRLHAWHRSTQLKGYAGLLEAMDRRLARGPGTQDVAWAVDGVKTQSRQLVQHAFPDAAAFLATLSDPQIAAARRQFDRDNRKFAKEHGVGRPAVEQKRLRAKRDLETIEHWSGPLDAEQRARFTALSEAQPLEAASRHQDRMRRQREFVALLEQRHDTRFPDRLREWLLDWNANRPADLDARLDEYDQAHIRMLLQVYSELRPDQQRKVQDRLRGYIDAMRDLARGDARQQANAGAIQPGASLP
jgi:signal transduction histidine kinase